MDLTLSLQAKGLGGLTARVGTILARFGLTGARMERRLTEYADLVESFGTRPTLPITACVLARHPRQIRKLAARGVEFAIHGLVHNDHARLGPREQSTSIARAAAIFRGARVACAGFRGPYLRYNAGTDAAVRELGLRYHSSQAVVFPVLPPEIEHGPHGERYQRALRLYGARDARTYAVRPRCNRGVVDIPVALPDDEIMIDRLHLDPAAQQAAWLGILEQTHAAGELFTVQLHPERIRDMAVALRAVLRTVQTLQPRVWMARLDEIADWWSRRDRWAVRVEKLGRASWRVRLEAEPTATLLVRGLSGVPACAWYGRDLVAEGADLEVRSDVKPIVGVSGRTASAVRDFLHEEGFPFEDSDHPERYGAYLDLPDEWLDEVGLLAELDRAPGPLVRLWRWPSEARSALAVTGDIDSITLRDFVARLWEGRR